jgi:hypothetical protein
MYVITFSCLQVLKTKKKIDEWTWFKNFQDAKEEVKKGWVILCDYILEWVNRKWSDKMIKSNRHVSEVITASDKAYAILILKSNLMSWITKGSSKSGKTNSPFVACVSTANSNNDDDFNGENGNDNDDNEATNEDNENTAEDAKSFHKLCSHFKNLRATGEYLTWDQGYQDAIAQAISDSRSKVSTSSGTISSKSGFTLGQPKSDDQDDEDQEFVECDEW